MGKLRAFDRSVPPPKGRARRSAVLPGRMPEVACPFCGGAETEPAAIYGCNMMTAQYYCRDCRTVFDWVRDEWVGVEPADPAD